MDNVRRVTLIVEENDGWVHAFTSVEVTECLITHRRSGPDGSVLRSYEVTVRMGDMFEAVLPVRPPGQ